MTLSSRSFHSLNDYAHHTRMLVQKLRLEEEIWFIVCCFLNDIPNSHYHWIGHDKDPKSFKDVVNITWLTSLNDSF